MGKYYKVFIIFSVLIFMSFCRDHRYWYVKQTLLNGDVIEITFDKNEKHVWGYIPHIHTSGGGDIKYKISFKYKRDKYTFETKASLVLINIWKGDFFIVTKDFIDKGDNYEYFLRYFKTQKNKFREIKPALFPHSIAIPNIYSFNNYPEIKDPEIINPLLEDFKETITAGLWLNLNNGISYHASWKPEYKQTLIDYKKKYIDPYWTEKAIKDNFPVVVKKEKDKNK